MTQGRRRTARMPIPTEPIGSIPRPAELIAAVAAGGADALTQALHEAAVRDTVERFEATGSPVITDGEQAKVHNFWDYSVTGVPNTAPDGFRIPFAAGHVRRMPRLTSGPFRGAQPSASGCRWQRSARRGPSSASRALARPRSRTTLSLICRG